MKRGWGGLAKESDWRAAAAGPSGCRAMLRFYRFRQSTNVERVALVLAHKGIEVESVLVDPDDRANVVAASGQDLVPVLVDGDEVITDSTRIMHWLDERFPERPVFPADPQLAANVEIFIDWFNRVWKREPNLIADALDAGRTEGEDLDRWTGAAAAPARPLRGDAHRPRVPVRRVRRGRLRRLAVPALRRGHRPGRPVDVPHGHQRADAAPGPPRNLRAWIARMGERPIA